MPLEGELRGSRLPISPMPQAWRSFIRENAGPWFAKLQYNCFSSVENDFQGEFENHRIHKAVRARAWGGWDEISFYLPLPKILGVSLFSPINSRRQTQCQAGGEQAH